MFHVATKNSAPTWRAVVMLVVLIAVLSCQSSALAATVTWDDGATDPPNPPGDGNGIALYTLPESASLGQ